MKKHLTLLFFLLMGSLSLFAQNLSTQIQAFDTYAEKAMQSWQMPGMAVAVVKDGQILFKKAYGVRQLGTTNMVNTQTQFACASTTNRAIRATVLSPAV